MTAFEAGFERLPNGRYRIGFATRGVDTAFSQTVTESVQRAAEEAGMNLITISSHRSARTALRNAALLVKEKVDLVIEFQSHERVASTIASLFLEASIPVVAIEIPHPGATFFGANNYQAGLTGRARYCKVGQTTLEWQSRYGPACRRRRGWTFGEAACHRMLAGLTEVLPSLDTVQTIHLDGRGSLEYTLDLVRRHLRRSPVQRTVVLATNDPSALGSIRAFEECGRAHSCCVMGQNASREARIELRRKHTSLVGSVGYFPERYGDEIIRLAASILQGQKFRRPSLQNTNSSLLKTWAGSIRWTNLFRRL